MGTMSILEDTLSSEPTCISCSFQPNGTPIILKNFDTSGMPGTVSLQKKLYKLVAGLKGRDAKSIAHQIVIEYVKRGNSQTLERLKSPDSEQWERIPVKMEQFLSDPFYLGDIENLRDLLRDDLIALFDTRQYAEAVIDGSIGWGKSTFVSICFTK